MALPPSLTGMTARRSPMLPKQRITLPVRFKARAVAAGRAIDIRIDQASVDFGCSDGLAGRGFEPGSLDPLSYSLGFIDGRNQRRSKGD